jgi:predicted MFS family arabinose efflux permease
VFAVPGFRTLWYSGWLWHLSRWMASFLGAYVVNQQTGSPRLVQLTGVAMWAPLLLGGAVGGLVSDRVDRRRTLLVQLAFTSPLAAVMGVLAITDRLETWMVYVFAVMIGVGWVTDMTSRRALVFDLVGGGRIDSAMALESVSMSGGIALGTLAGGTVVDLIGVGAAFLTMAVLVALAFLLMTRLPHVDAERHISVSPKRDFVEGLGLLRTNAVVVSILGITVLFNFFYFSHFPMVQVVADRVDASPALTGLLASASGFGMITGSLLVARWQPERRGLVYVGGSLFAMVAFLPFALSDVYGVVLTSYLVASVGGGLFGSTQSTLVMTAVPAALRGRAMGLLSMAIGALPIGMLCLGELAERTSSTVALTTFLVLGAVGIVLWQVRHPEAVRLRASDGPVP